MEIYTKSGFSNVLIIAFEFVVVILQSFINIVWYVNNRFLITNDVFFVISADCKYQGYESHSLIGVTENYEFQLPCILYIFDHALIRGFARL